MHRNVTNEITRVCQILNKNEVQYLIVGGAAVAYHGYFRWSENSDGTQADKFDLDIWYSPTYDNYFKLLNALAELDQDVKEFFAEKSPNPQKSYFKFDLEKFTLDFLPKLKGSVKFKQAYENKEITTINGIDLLFIGFDELLKDKAANSRPKDLEDIKQLKSIKNK